LQKLLSTLIEPIERNAHLPCGSCEMSMGLIPEARAQSIPQSASFNAWLLAILNRREDVTG
jgi:hypothetical protein